LFSSEHYSAGELISRAARGDSTPGFALDPSREFRFAVCMKTRRDSAQNVVAVLEGSDPVLKHEYIVIGAHYDGQGLQVPPVNGDSIMNSAEDNASGSAGLLQVARAFARGPRPKRSVIFAWFTWEEVNLNEARLGSKFFVAQPPVPLKAIRAMINLDEIGIVPSDTLGSVALGFNKNTALRDKVLATNAAYLKVTLRPENWGDAAHSDRGAFAQLGIPYLAFEADGGDDHSVTDEAQLIDYAALERMVRTVYVSAWRLASEPHLPLK
jgi:Zn-dependent M28 family amino/carboxypeptidase